MSRSFKSIFTLSAIMISLLTCMSCDGGRGPYLRRVAGIVADQTEGGTVYRVVATAHGPDERVGSVMVVVPNNPSMDGAYIYVQLDDTRYDSESDLRPCRIRIRALADDIRSTGDAVNENDANYYEMIAALPAKAAE